jgi:hypothetical protein
LTPGLCRWGRGSSEHEQGSKPCSGFELGICSEVTTSQWPLEIGRGFNPSGSDGLISGPTILSVAIKGLRISLGALCVSIRILLDDSGLSTSSLASCLAING